MEPYILEVKINGRKEILLVYSLISPDTDEYLIYEIFQGPKSIGKIYPLINDNLQIDWVTNDLIATELVKEIGEKIESIDM